MTNSLRAFLMSDIEGSNAHWASEPRAMTEAVATLDLTVGAVVSSYRGDLLKARGEGDSHFAVFALATDAVLAGCALQDRLSEPVESLEIQVRIAIHVGEVDAIADDYYGTTVNQTARLRAAAHGRQTVVSHVTAMLAEPALADRVALRSLGYHRIRDFPHLEEVFQASSLGDDRSFPPLRVGESHGPALMAVAVVDICGTTAVV
jgi:class 3 adenylate cyclase